jgi:hypothetical protein
MTSSTIRTCLWFRDGRGREAAEFYCSLIPGSRVESTFSIDNPGHDTSSIINFSLGGVPYQILDAGPMFTLTEASVDLGRDCRSSRDGSAVGGTDGEWRRGKPLRLAEGPLWGFVADFPEATDGIDDECRQKRISQGDGGHDEADENRHRRNRSSGS